MTKIRVIVELDEGDEWADPEHEIGITEAAYNRLTSFTEHGGPPLGWLGEIVDVERVGAGRDE